MSLKPRAKRQQGSVLIGALVLIALLFFIETALAAAVASTLHSVRVIDSQAGVRYAAESAAARGIAAGEVKQACPASTVINGVSASTTCFTLSGIRASTSSVEQWGMADQSLGASGCAVMALPANVVIFGEEPGAITIWTVLAWRSTGGTSTGISAWIDTTQTCTQQLGVCAGAGGRPSPPTGMGTPGVANFLAVTCPDADTHYYLHLVNTGGPVEVSPFVVRGSLQGSDAALVAVGAADTELDEAQVLLPGTPSPGVLPTQDLWDTLLR